MHATSDLRFGLMAAAVLAVVGFGPARAADDGQKCFEAAAQICVNVVSLERNTRAFDECAASLAASASLRGQSAPVAAALTHSKAPVKSYFYVSSTEAQKRRRDACAALGYDPARADLGQCMADLNAALVRAAHPWT